MLYAFLRLLIVLLAKVLFRIRVAGWEHVPRSGPVILASNHLSFLDPPLIGGACPRSLYFMAKAELFTVPGFSWLIRSLHAFPLRREGADPVALRQALELLRRGMALLLFPEGTRGREGALQPGKPGAGMLAVSSEAPVVPVYIQGSGRAWPRGQRFPRPAPVTVTFGPPLRFDRASGKGKGHYQAVSHAMMAAIGVLKASVEGQSDTGAEPGAKAKAKS